MNLQVCKTLWETLASFNFIHYFKVIYLFRLVPMSLSIAVFYKEQLAKTAAALKCLTLKSPSALENMYKLL